MEFSQHTPRLNETLRIFGRFVRPRTARSRGEDHEGRHSDRGSSNRHIGDAFPRSSNSERSHFKRGSDLIVDQRLLIELQASTEFCRFTGRRWLTCGYWTLNRACWSTSTVDDLSMDW